MIVCAMSSPYAFCIKISTFHRFQRQFANQGLVTLVKVSGTVEECINHGTFRLGSVVTVAQVAQHPTVQMTRKENKTFPSIDDFPKRSRVFTY